MITSRTAFSVVQDNAPGVTRWRVFSSENHGHTWEDTGKTGSFLDCYDWIVAQLDQFAHERRAQSGPPQQHGNA